MKSIVFT